MTEEKKTDVRQTREYSSSLSNRDLHDSAITLNALLGVALDRMSAPGAPKNDEKVPETSLPLHLLPEVIHQADRWRERAEKEGQTGDNADGMLEKPANCTLLELRATQKAVLTRPRFDAAPLGQHSGYPWIVVALQDSRDGGYVLWNPSLDAREDSLDQLFGNDDDGVFSVSVKRLGYTVTGTCFLSSAQPLIRASFNGQDDDDSGEAGGDIDDVAEETGGAVFCVANEKHAVMRYNLSARDPRQHVGKGVAVAGRWEAHGTGSGSRDLYYPQDVDIVPSSRSGEPDVLVVSDGANNRLCCFDAATGAMLREVSTGNHWPTGLSVNRELSQVCVCLDDGVYVYSFADLSQVSVLRGEAKTYSLAIDSGVLVSIVSDDGNNTLSLRLRNTADPKEPSSEISLGGISSRRSGHRGIGCDSNSRRVVVALRNHELWAFNFGAATKAARKR
jgi:hypothetical protein